MSTLLEEMGDGSGQGGELSEHRRSLDAEMGSPEDLGRGFKQLYRPRRWLDFLLVVVPALVISPLLTWVISWFTGPLQGAWHADQPLLWISIRVSIILSTLLLGASLWRRSLPLLFYWLPQAIAQLFVLVYREQRLLPGRGPYAQSAGGLAEDIFWLAALAGLIIWLAVLMVEHRQDVLLLALAVLPFLYMAANMSTASASPDGQVSFVIGWFGLSQVSSLAWPALFYLPRRRAWRWLGLLVFALPYLVYYSWPYRNHPLQTALFTFPALLVIFAWLVEGLLQQRRHSLAKPL
jgi:hypothetical protein